MDGRFVGSLDGWLIYCAVYARIYAAVAAAAAACTHSPKNTQQTKRKEHVLYYIGLFAIYIYRVSATNILNAVAVVCLSVCLCVSVCFIFLRLTNFNICE